MSRPAVFVVKGTKWRHRNGIVYEVLLVANLASTRPEYPVTVVYQGQNGNIWSRPLSDWHRSFVLVEENKIEAL